MPIILNISLKTNIWNTCLTLPCVGYSVSSSMFMPKRYFRIYVIWCSEEFRSLTFMKWNLLDPFRTIYNVRNVLEGGRCDMLEFESGGAYVFGYGWDLGSGIGLGI